ncbi:MAG: MFS transporter [Chloroflexota bacterium]|nr:MAG: MFS transporter [Chloroflexota bacterium]
MSSLEKAGQKITTALLVSQSLFSASVIMLFTISSIIAVQLAGDNSQWTGVPSTLILVGAALVAYPIGRLMDQFGRRIGLSVGHLFGIGGALIAGAAVIQESLWLFLGGVLLMGLAKGVIDLGRYAAAEANIVSKRARAISLVVLGGTVGSISGPALIKWTGVAAERFNAPSLSGPWFAAALFLAISLVMITIFLRPDPQQIGRQLAALEPGPTLPAQEGRSFQEVFFNEPRAKLAVAAMVFGQLTMVWVMTITPVHMHHHAHGIAAISWVFMAHTLGMFGLSFPVGWLVDRLGRVKMIIIGSLLLVASCLLAPLSAEVYWLVIVLFLLGLGWNCCFVAGSTLLADILRSHEKGRVQGLADAVVNVASGVGSLGGGFVFAATSFTTMSWLGLLAALVPLALVLFLRSTRSKVALEGTVTG